MEDIDELIQELIDVFDEEVEESVEVVSTIGFIAERVQEEGSIKEKELFLTTLLDRLEEKEKIELVQKISWDLPEVLIEFYHPNSICLKKALSQSSIVTNVMKCFNRIALVGDSKRCFLIGCELIENLDGSKFAKIDFNEQDKLCEFAQGERQYDRNDPIDFFFDLQFHVLFELIKTSLLRIKCLNPSKYLNIAVTAFIKVMSRNVNQLNDTTLVLRRIFTFCRGYSSNMVSYEELESSCNINEEEWNKLIENDNLLQAKLLRRLLTFAINENTKKISMKLDPYYLMTSSGKQFMFSSSLRKSYVVSSRFFQLSQAFDVNYKEWFSKHIEECRQIYKSLPNDDEVVNEKAIYQVTRELAYTFELQKMARERDICMDSNGVFILSAFSYVETGQIMYPEIRVSDSIYMYLRHVTPGLYSKKYESLTCESASRFWLWVALKMRTSGEIEADLAELPTHVVLNCFESILMCNVIEVNQNQRMMSFTLLTRLLCVVKSSVVIRFVLQILNGDNTSAKSCILGIMKDMMQREKRDDIASELSELSLAPRHKKFLVLEKPEMTQISQIIVDQIEMDNCTEDDMWLLLNYIKYLISVHESWNRELLVDVQEHLQKNLQPKQLLYKQLHEASLKLKTII